MGQRLRNFAIALEEINRLNPKPDFILHTGDLVEWNNPNFLMAFKGILESCDLPSYFIPGNHDRRTWEFDWAKWMYGDDALAVYHEYINPSGEDNYSFPFENFLFIGLDSGKDCNNVDVQGDGLSVPQINFLHHLDNEYPGPKIIFMHHPAVNDDKAKLESHDDYAPGENNHCIFHNRHQFILYCIHHNVQLVLTGHTHQNKFFKVDKYRPEASRTNADDGERPLFIQTLSATKDASEGNGFGYIKVDKDKATYESKDFTCRPKDEKITSIGVLGNFTPHAYDSQGRHTGWSDAGYVERNIPRSYHTGIYDGKIISQSSPHMVVLFADDDYHIELKLIPSLIEQQNMRQQTIQENGEEVFFNVISVRTCDNDSFTDLYYNITITQNGTASITLNQTDINYTMEIDYDGDGDVDEYKSPDSTETNYAPTAAVFSPENDSIFVHGDEITFSGAGTDPEDGTLTNTSLVWSSDIDGLIGFGNEFSTSNLSAGTHTITLKVNDSAYLIDTDSVEILVNAPDLTLNSSDIIFSNSDPAAGELITINATIRNIGLIDATNVRVEFYDGIPEFQISNVTISTIRAGETETVNVTWDTTGKMGKHTISVAIDPEDSIEEMNETNDQATKSVVVKEYGINLCGDVAPCPDCDGTVDMGDVILLLNNVSYPENPRYVLCNDWAGDCRCTGVRDMGDVILLLNNVSYPENPIYALDCC